MRHSRAAAEAEAIRIAGDFIAASGNPGWHCLGAKPHPFEAKNRRRKDVTRWIVMFDPSIGNVVLDGPALVRVDIESGEVGWSGL